MNRVRLLVADDQAAFREGLVTLLSTMPDFEIVAESEDGMAAVRSAHRTKPDVVLMDLRMPELDGVQATRRLHAELPATRVLVLTTFDDDASILDAIRAGAVGYLLKDANAAEIGAAVRQAAAGVSSLAPSVATRLVQMTALAPGVTPPCAADVPSGLTAREIEVLRLVSRGSANKDIAAALGISEGTVKNHVSALIAKLGVTDRLQVALVARQAGYF